jgi:hypothetical protein
VGGNVIRPKSIARDLFELGLTFNEYVNEYGLRRSEGVLLRYLMDAYKTLGQTVPEDAKTDAVLDLEEWLGGTVRGVDASLLDEWERMKDPEAYARRATEPVVDEVEDVTRNVRGFTVLVRNALWRVVQAISRRHWTRVAELVRAPEGTWDAAAIEAMVAPFFEEHERVRTDPDARSPRHVQVDADGSSGSAGSAADGPVWKVVQTLLDPESHGDFQLAFEVPLDASREEGDAVLVLVGRA